MRPIVTDVWRGLLHSCDNGPTAYCTCVCVCVSVTKWHPAKTAGTIEMPFGMWGRVGPSNRVLDGRGLDPSGEGAILGISCPLNTIADGAYFAAVRQVALWRNDQRVQVRSQGTYSRGGHRWACPGIPAVGILNKTMRPFIEILRSLVPCPDATCLSQIVHNVRSESGTSCDILPTNTAQLFSRDAGNIQVNLRLIVVCC